MQQFFITAQFLDKRTVQHLLDVADIFHEYVGMRVERSLTYEEIIEVCVKMPYTLFSVAFLEEPLIFSVHNDDMKCLIARRRHFHFEMKTRKLCYADRCSISEKDFVWKW